MNYCWLGRGLGRRRFHLPIIHKKSTNRGQGIRQRFAISFSFSFSLLFFFHFLLNIEDVAYIEIPEVICGSIIANIYNHKLN